MKGMILALVLILWKDASAGSTDGLHGKFKGQTQQRAICVIAGYDWILTLLAFPISCFPR